MSRRASNAAEVLVVIAAVAVFILLGVAIMLGKIF